MYDILLSGAKYAQRNSKSFDVQRSRKNIYKKCIEMKKKGHAKLI